MQKRDAKGHFVSGSMSSKQKKRISQGQIERYKRQAEDLEGVPEKKFCNGCSKWKLIEGNFTVQARKLKSGRMGYYPAHRCHECKREQKRKWRAENREHVRELQRKAHAKRQSDEKKRAKRAKYMREYGRIQRALAGGNPRGPWKRYAHEIKGYTPLVPVGPFVEWFEGLNGNRPTESEMGKSLARTVRRCTSGRADHIHLEQVDAVGVVAGQPQLHRVLYPDA